MDDEYEAYLAKLDPELQKRIKLQVHGLTTGLRALAPLTCVGPHECPFIDHCPIPRRQPGQKPDLLTADAYPLYDDCVMERLYLQAKIASYKEYLKVEDDNPIELSIVNDLALIDLYKNRATMIMSSGDKRGSGVDFMREDVEAIFGDEGQIGENTKTQLHPAVDMIDRLEKRRERLLDRLMETRKGRLEAQKVLGLGSNESKVLEELRKVRQLLTAHSEDALLLALDEEEIKIT